MILSVFFCPKVSQNCVSPDQTKAILSSSVHYLWGLGEFLVTFMNTVSLRKEW